jgi:PASTA domain
MVAVRLRRCLGVAAVAAVVVLAMQGSVIAQARSASRALPLRHAGSVFGGLFRYMGTTSAGNSVYVGIDVVSQTRTEIDLEVPNPYGGSTHLDQKYECTSAASTVLSMASKIFFVASIPPSGVFSARVSYPGGIDIYTVTGHIVGTKLTGTYSDTQHSPAGTCITGVIPFTASLRSRVGVSTGNGTSGGGKGTGGGSGSGSVRCIVPKLAGSTLALAAKMLARAHCKLGTVTQPKPKPKTGTTLIVSSSSPTVGTRLASGAKVNVKLRRA